MKRAAKEIQAAKRPIDILVNIAGINQDALFPMMTKGDRDLTFEVNLFSRMTFSQYVTRLMQRNPTPRKSMVFTSLSWKSTGDSGSFSSAFLS